MTEWLIYSQIKIFRPKDLNLNLQNRIKEIIKKKGPYLYGHAIWKCRIVKDYLLTLPENSILQYSDIGCHLNKEGIEKFKEYISEGERLIVNIPFPEINRRIKGVLAINKKEDVTIALINEKF